MTVKNSGLSVGWNRLSICETELDAGKELQAAAVDDWGERMIRLNRRQGIEILGGGGTGPQHLEYLVHRRRIDKWRWFK